METASEKRMKQHQAQRAIHRIIANHKRAQVKYPEGVACQITIDEEMLESLDVAAKAIDELLALECAIKEAPQKITPVDLPANQPEKEESTTVERKKIINALCLEFKTNESLKFMAGNSGDSGDVCFLAFKDGEENEALEYLHKHIKTKKRKEEVLFQMRDAIQAAEEFDLVRTESGQVITGAIMTECGVMLTKE